MKIVLVRHGTTEYNEKKVLQGKSNIPLNDTGRRECYKLKEQLKDIDFDICFSSPLIRTVETAMILVGDRVFIQPDKRLEERNLGDLEGKSIKLYDSKKYWDYSLNYKENNVEPIQDLMQRCKDFLNDLEKDYSKQKVLVVAHGAVIKALYHLIKKTDLNSDLSKIKIENCCNIELEK